VPDVVGLTRSSAERMLEGRGLAVSVDRRRSDATENDVIAQSPSAGAGVDEGSRVKITVSSGPGTNGSKPPPAAQPPPSKPDTQKVPDVGGLSASDAADRLRAAGFDVATTQRDVSDQGQDDKVIDQSPGAGSQMPTGSTVTIVVGRYQQPSGPPQPTTPKRPAVP
jgi:eukaryotic-like serine/threonine-protein kinase